MKPASLRAATTATAGLWLLVVASSSLIIPLVNSFHPYPVTPSFRYPTPLTPKRAPTTRCAAAPTDSASASVDSASRTFDRAVRYEARGLFREAAESFRAALTLYEQQQKRSSSSISDPDRAILAYAYVRLAHLTHDALGDSAAAASLYRAAADLDPGAVALDGMATSLEAAGGKEPVGEEVVTALQKAHRARPSSNLVLFHLALALQRLAATGGGAHAAEAASSMAELRSRPSASHLLDSYTYVRSHAPSTANLYRGTRAVLQLALSAAAPLLRSPGPDGLVCEFGVATGRSVRMLREMLGSGGAGVRIHGFDTFTGIPEAWGDEPAGSYSTGGVRPEVSGEVEFHAGLFRDTVPGFLEGLGDGGEEGGERPLAFANVDCDLYGSTMDVLEGMRGRVVVGTVLVFDEYVGHPTWRGDEFRAWQECCGRFGWKYRYLGFSLGTKQAVVQVTAVV